MIYFGCFGLFGGEENRLNQGVGGVGETWKMTSLENVDHTDGRNPEPVEVGGLSHYLQGLYIPGGTGFLPSTVFPLL